MAYPHGTRFKRHLLRVASLTLACLSVVAGLSAASSHNAGALLRPTAPNSALKKEFVHSSTSSAGASLPRQAGAPFYTSGTLNGSDYGIRYFGGESTSLGGWWQGCDATPFTGGRVDCIRRFTYATFTLPSAATLSSIHVWVGGFNNWGLPFVPSLKAEVYVGDLLASANASALVGTSETTLVDNYYPTGAEKSFTFANPVVLSRHTPYTLRILIPSGTFGDFAAGSAFALYGAYTADQPTTAYAGDTVIPSEFNGDVRNLPRPPLRPEREVELEVPSVATKPRSSPATGLPTPRNIKLAPMPGPVLSFDGQSVDDRCGQSPCDNYPPDVNGDVGRNHYIQAVNYSLAVYAKTGALLASFSEDELWKHGQPLTGSPCEGHSYGDPAVIYDQFTDRWILTNLAFSSDTGPFYQCIAVSKTGDPIAGGYWLYALRIDPGGTGRPPNGSLNDYPKFGNWNDGCLYMSANEFRYTDRILIGTLFGSLNKNDLESGAPLNWALGFIPYDGTLGMLPSNISGATASASLPLAGTPNYFVADSTSKCAFEVRKFTPGAQCGGGGSMSPPADVEHAKIFYPDDGASDMSSNNIVPQPPQDKIVLLDSGGGAHDHARLMQKAQYRRVGDEESLWVTHTVRTSEHTGATGQQWAQIDVTGRVVAAIPRQQQIYKPEESLYRWMGSIAADREGNVALGYSTSNATHFPSIAYSGRLAGDPPNYLPRTETQLIAGNGSQNSGTQVKPFARWGDYTSMSVDPTDDCTFWYTNQYYNSQEKGNIGRWQTRIGSFRFPTCSQQATPLANLSITKATSANPAEVGRIFTYNITVSNAGPDAATGVMLTDALPAGVTFNSATPSQGSCALASGTLTCQLGSLAANASASVALQVKPRQTGMLGNTASVSAYESDPDTSDNSATSNINVIKTADLKVAKTDSTDPIFVGEQVTYTMLVTNLGPLNGATGVTLIDTLPASMTFVSATTTQGSLITPPVGSAGIITANIGSMAVGAQASVTVTVKATQAGVISNSASASSSETDTNTANNTAAQTTIVKAATLLKMLLAKQVLSGGCEGTNGNVYLTGPAPAGGLTVNISTTSLAGVTVPASVFIPSGSSVSPNFSVTTTTVATKQVGLVNATLGASTVSRGLTINVGSGSCQ